MAVQVIGDAGTVTAVEPSYAVEVSSAVVVGGEPYEGAYEVTPSTAAQVLGTSGKLMGGDVTVEGIAATATDADVLAGKSYFGAAGLSTGGMPDNGAVGGEIAARDASVAIPAGRTSGGSVSIAQAAKASITPENIKEGVDILGVVGTFAGGGGGVGELVKEESLGHIKTTSTSNVNLNKTITLDVSDYDVLVFAVWRPGSAQLTHKATVRAVALTGSRTYDVKDGYSMTRAESYIMINGNYFLVSYSNPYGIFPNNVTFSNGVASFDMYARYNDTLSGKIDGDYTASIYGLNCLDLIGA